MHTMKITSARNKPCGTPLVTFLQFDKLLLITALHILLVRKFVIHVRTLLVTPPVSSSFQNYILNETLSKDSF